MMDWEQKFEEFTKKKERQAREANIPGYVTTIDNAIAYDHLATLRHDGLESLYHGMFYYTHPLNGELPSVNTVFVQSADFNTGADNPGDLGGGETDYHLIFEGLTRVGADGVLAGA